jgi:hypothetical protein
MEQHKTKQAGDMDLSDEELKRILAIVKNPGTCYNIVGWDKCIAGVLVKHGKRRALALIGGMFLLLLFVLTIYRITAPVQDPNVYLVIGIAMGMLALGWAIVASR